MRRLIIGCGYLGRRAARAWQERGDAVWALTRSTRHASELASEGVRPILGDVLDSVSLRLLPTVDTVLCAVGYDRSAAPSKREVYVDGLRNVLRALSPQVDRLISVSSTSVYGQSQGEWVDEASPCMPTSEGGEICLSAEKVARDSFVGRGGCSILRLAGLYGPGRLAARRAALMSGRPIDANPDGWINLIHVDDARDVILASADRPAPIDTLLVSDGHPQLRRDYYQRLAEAIGAPQPVFSASTSDDQFGKRCANGNLRRWLDIDLRYDSIIKGLPTAI